MRLEHHVLFIEIGIFQSTHPQGVRRLVASHVNPVLSISIHAPSRGATPPAVVSVSFILFQSTHPQGVRREQKLAFLKSAAKFQSTHPQGVRLERAQESSSTVYFNPRTLKGCDNKGDTRHLLRRDDFNPRTLKGCDFNRPFN